ncbi:ATP-dependent nuclease [Lysinibacillus capsici]|uniref:ATP-dependent nuclease n=1 Tax=Lysinibacillus capsici TaxID=2115968 RepID=UPI0028AD5FDB|nr:AAA family ATPase [Lysinibacillus capsici]
MIRTAGEIKNWEKLYKRNFEYSLISMNLNGAGGITNMELNKGIFAICGLNGAGKSTIISSLKDVLGLDIDQQDINKIKGKDISAKIENQERTIDISNKDGERFVDLVAEKNLLKYLDYQQSNKILDNLEQENLEEYLEQFENVVLETDEIRKINYIVGKHYNEITLVEIEDGDLKTPYFKVKISEFEYDSLSMGIGEHFLFYIFWELFRAEKNGIILIEEPETFISVDSQKKLMNFIAERALKLGSTVIISTHSPYIIKNIQKDNILILNRFIDNVSLIKPTNNIDSLISLGMELPKRGCIYVEDNVAELFLKILLRKNLCDIENNYDIEVVNGYAEITKRLEFPYSPKIQYKIIGVYDGDMKEEILKHQERLKWGFSFLPIEPSVEEEFIVSIENNHVRVANLMGIDVSNIVSILSRIQGQDHHDWFINFCKGINRDMSFVINIVYDIWLEQGTNEDRVNEFLSEIVRFCN